MRRFRCGNIVHLVAGGTAMAAELEQSLGELRTVCNDQVAAA
jgi:hypothetical protein